MKANYKTYRVNLRYDTDQDLIDYIELRKDAEGVTPIIREALQKLKKEGWLKPSKNNDIQACMSSRKPRQAEAYRGNQKLH